VRSGARRNLLTLVADRNSINCNVRFPALAAAVIGCAAAFGAASDNTDGANRPPWRIYKVATTWSVSETVVTQLPSGQECRTAASLVGSGSPFYVGTPATKRITSFGVRFAKIASGLAYGKRRRNFVVPAQMTLTVGRTVCDEDANGGSCAGTYNSRGGILGFVKWFAKETAGERSGMNWSHKIASADHRPPQSCGQAVGEPVYELFFGGFYKPVSGGAYSDAKGVPLSRKQLIAGKRFTSSLQGQGDTRFQKTKATFTPVR
jgi:hypothetical protein